MASLSHATKENEPRSPPSDNDETVVEELSKHFSKLNSKFCDHMSQQLQQIFAERATDFPRLEQPQALLERLTKSYVRHIDVAEVYAGRNIFTLDNLPPNRQARIARLFHTTPDMTDIALELKPAPDETNNASDEHVNVDLEKLTADPPPTKEQVQVKRQSVQDLQEKIIAARQQKAVLQRRVRELEIAQQMSAWPEDSTADKVQDSVSTLMIGVHGMEECQDEGEAAVQEAKKRRRRESMDDAGLDWGPFAPQPKNVQQVYEQERKRVQATVKDLQYVHGLLVGQNTRDESV